MKCNSFNFSVVALLVFSAFAAGVMTGWKGGGNPDTDELKIAQINCAECAKLVSVFEVINANAETKVMEAANDLLSNNLESRFYRDTHKWVIVDNNLWVISHPDLRVKYSIAPLGPKKIFDVKQKSWSYEE